MDAPSSAPEIFGPFDSSPEPFSNPELSDLPNRTPDWEARYAWMLGLQTAGMRLASSLDWDVLLDETIRSALSLFRADGVSLILPHTQMGEFYIAKSYHLPDDIVQTWRIRVGEGVVGWVASHRQALLLTSSKQVAQYGSAPDNQISSSIVAPIMLAPTQDAESFLGVLTLSRQVSKLPFAPVDAQVATVYCQQLALALRNTYAYRQAQRRVAQSNNLAEISRALISSLKVDQVLSTLMLKAVELLHCESGSLMLLDEEEHELVFKVAVGPASQKVVGTRLPMNVGIVGAVLRSAKPLIVNDAKADPRHYSDVDATTDLTTRTLLCVPLVNQQRVLGVIEVINREDGQSFDDDDLQLLSAYATQGTIALGNAQLYSQLKQSFTDTVSVIANAVEARDPYTAGHTARVTRYAMDVAHELGWSEQQIEWLQIGGLLHDIGKVGITDLILHKPGGLTNEEYAEMKRHPIVGVQMLEGVSALRPALPYILYHQERYDGSGYPFGLAKEEIPIEGRLLAVVDTFDAMTSDRPYRKGLSENAALDEIRRNSGTQFDPIIAAAFIRIKEREQLAQASPRD